MGGAIFWQEQSTKYARKNLQKKIISYFVSRLTKGRLFPEEYIFIFSISFIKYFILCYFIFCYFRFILNFKL